MTNKPRCGRPSKYSTSTTSSARKYTKSCIEIGNFPTTEGLATYLGVGARTLYDWEAEYSDFSQTMENVRDTQRQMLITNGLEGKYNSRFAMFLLKANHGYKENE